MGSATVMLGASRLNAFSLLLVFVALPACVDPVIIASVVVRPARSEPAPAPAPHVASAAVVPRLDGAPPGKPQVRYGGRFLPTTGCALRQEPLNNLACGGEGCGSICGGDPRLDYEFETTPGESYEAVFLVDDYRHNCRETLQAGLFVDGRRLGTFTGLGVSAWAPAEVDFTATAASTRVGITLDNDACCGCSHTCDSSCSPLYGDLNLYVARVTLTPLGHVASPAPPAPPASAPLAAAPITAARIATAPIIAAPVGLVPLPAPLAAHQRACDGGDLHTCVVLGEALYNGTSVSKDGARAVQLFRKACDGSEPTGCVDLGWAYVSGTGVTKDSATAALQFGKACSASVAIGCFGLGVLHRDGLGVPKDPVRATALLKQACDGGVPAACTALR